MARLPTLCLPHGGGPWPFVELGLDRREVTALADWLRTVRDVPGGAVRALLVVSAHWEEPVPTVQSGAAPELYYDYYGFPPASYQLRWGARGEPALAALVRATLAKAGLPSAEHATRGYDHGTFVPLMLPWPGGEVPVVQLSLVRGLDPAAHLRLGRALAPLRDEGVFLIGSGMSFHNMQLFGHPSAAGASVTFDTWLDEAACAEPEERDRRLEAWAKAPGARLSHPREEHLLPLMVVAGAAGADRGRRTFAGTMMGAKIGAWQYG